jgi:integrase/recombinase XerD
MKSPILNIQLETFTECNVYGSIILDYRPNIDELYNVRYRLTYKGKRKYFPAGYAYSLEDWKRIASNKVRNETLKKDKVSIINGFKVIEEKISEIVNTDKKPFSFDLLFKKILRGDRTDLFMAFNDKINRLMNEDRIGSAISYTSTLASFWTFINEYKESLPFTKLYKSGDWLKNQYKSLSFNQINDDLVKRYKQHLKDENKSDATIGIYLRNFRAILNENDIPAANYPFGKDKVSIPKGSSRKIALSKQVISLLAQHPLVENPKMYRDLWMFSYLCNGANLKDIFRLKQKNIQANFIYFKRAKTERTSKDPKEIQVHIHAEMQRIIDEYGIKFSKKEEYLFPFLKQGISAIQEAIVIADYTKRINKTMNRIASELEINVNITLYCARHSFAVNSERAGHRHSLISLGLGHSTIGQTTSYLGSFVDSEIIDNSNKLI